MLNRAVVVYPRDQEQEEVCHRDPEAQEQGQVLDHPEAGSVRSTITLNPQHTAAITTEDQLWAAMTMVDKT